MKKKILIHSIVFGPDGVSTAYLYNDIALKFAESGFEVVVLTTTPHYNIVEAELLKQPMVPKLGGLYYESYYHNIRVIHVPQRKFKSILYRVLGFIYWHFISLIIGLLQKNISLILSPSPPLTIGLVSIIIGKLKRAKVVYNVQEIYPDFLINQGGFKFKPVINILKRLERFVYNHSDAVTTIDTVFYNTILSRFTNKSKLIIIPNFVDTKIFKPWTDPLVLDQKLFAPKKNVLKLMYAGNIGHAQDWLPLIEVAKNLRDLPVEFWVVGEGVMKQKLFDDIRFNRLNNIHLVPYQAREYMPSLIAFADIHFIFMSPEMDGQGFPSKVYTIMACAKPLLVVSAKDTPLNNFLKTTNAAILIDEPNITLKCDIITENIKELLISKTRLIELGNNGFDLIQQSYTKEVVTSQYFKLANEIIENK
jgi:glycosyltransferase involved in cell wall biosynthesis